MNATRLVIVKPPVDVARYVQAFWFLEHTGVHSLTKTLHPDGGIGINLSNAPAMAASMPSPDLPRGGSFSVAIQPRSYSAGVRLQPGNKAFLPQLIDAVRTVWGNQPTAAFDSDSPIERCMRLCEALLGRVRSRSHTRTRTEDALELAMQHETGMSVARLAKLVGTTPRTLERDFARKVGMSPARFLTVQRYLCALDLVQRSDRELSDVALQAGYSDQAHMSRDFSHRLGISPLRARRRHAARVPMTITFETLPG